MIKLFYNIHFNVKCNNSKYYVQNLSVNDEKNNDEWECLIFLKLLIKVYNFKRLIK